MSYNAMNVRALKVLDMLSSGFAAGNYANAYETTDLSEALAKLSMNRSAEYVAAFTLGFFSTYSLGEMCSDVEAYREAYFSETGKACRKAGYMDIRPAEESTVLRSFFDSPVDCTGLRLS